MTKNLLYSCRIFTATVLLMIIFYFSKSAILIYSFFTLVLFLFRKDIDIKDELEKPLYFMRTLVCSILFLVFSAIISALFPVTSVVPEKSIQNVLIIVILGPLYEELFFRKLLTKGVTPILAPFLSSLVFGMFHGVEGFPSAFLAGLAFYSMYKFSGGIKLPFVVHAVNNAVALILC